MTVHARLMELYRDLDAMHAWRGWHWWPDADPFEVIVGCILVQNTSWTNVERALERLRAAGALDFEAMAALEEDTLRELVRPSGQYVTKARKLREFIALARSHGGLETLLALDPVILRSELLATWGIGPESADAIVLYAARQPAFVIDAYTQRVHARLGLGPHHTTDYPTWQRFFTGNLPEDRDLWARYHALVVLHCKHLCLKTRPRCGQCSLADRCSVPELP
jgi:endonuclease-3 related protein